MLAWPAGPGLEYRMTMTRILSPAVALALVIASASMQGQTPPPATPAPRTVAPGVAAGTRLPVRRVVLYKSGVGYFEHLGRVSGAQTVSIDLTSGQLDDVLKSLTTVDLGGGQVTGITFNTEAPIEEQLRKLRLPLAPDVTRTKLLEALRGARVEVRSAGGLVAGRILSVVQQVRGKEDGQRTVDELTIVGDGGELRSFELGPGVGVTIVEGELRRDLGQYLDVMGSARSQEVRRLQVAARGSGDRDLFVSYVSAVPVWKTTYRLVIPSETARKPFLQGWAIVDNTLGEDWTDVELSLVAGAPQSFIQELSKPIYTERPVVPIQTGTVVAPEIHGGAMTVGNATLRGRIVDNTGASLPGAVVKLLVGRADGGERRVRRGWHLPVARPERHGDGRSLAQRLQDGAAPAVPAGHDQPRHHARGRLVGRVRRRAKRAAVIQGERVRRRHRQAVERPIVHRPGHLPCPTTAAGSTRRSGRRCDGRSRRGRREANSASCSSTS